MTTSVLEKDSQKKAAAAAMQAAVIVSPGKVEVRELTAPEPGPAEVRIRMEGCGVCASNIPVWEGRDWFNYPLSPGEPGHEGWGVVEKLGQNVKNLRVGDRVCALSFHAYASHDIAREDEVVRLPESLANTPFPGEPLGCAMNIFARSDIKPGHTVAVVGSGFLGSLLVQAIKAEGARVIAISRRKYSLEVAEKCGADETIVMDDHWKIIEKVKELTGGRFCDRVIEATGKEWPLNLSIELTGERGKLIVAGFHQDGMRQVNMQTLNWRGIDLVSAHERDPQEYVKGMKSAISALTEGRINPRPLFSHRYKIEEIDKAFDCLVKRPDGFIKATIEF